MEPDKRSPESKSMFSVVERMNAGYEQFFDSKPKNSAVRNECYSNFKSCGAAPKNLPSVEVKTEKVNSEIEQNVAQQFFPQNDEPKQERVVIEGSGCCKYVTVKKEK